MWMFQPWGGPGPTWRRSTDSSGLSVSRPDDRFATGIPFQEHETKAFDAGRFGSGGCHEDVAQGEVLRQLGRRHSAEESHLRGSYAHYAAGSRATGRTRNSRPWAATKYDPIAYSRLA
jgi:hypothetical protein